MKMTEKNEIKYEYGKRFENKHNLLTVFFTRPSNELVKKDKRYNYVMFNHCGFITSYWGSIWEHVGGCIGFPQESSDIYLEPNHVKIILPVELNDEVKKVIKDNIAQYGNCTSFIINVLKDLKILPEDVKYDGVDELYLDLLKYRLSTEEVKDLFNRKEAIKMEEKEELEEPKEVEPEEKEEVKND